MSEEEVPTQETRAAEVEPTESHESVDTPEADESGPDAPASGESPAGRRERSYVRVPTWVAVVLAAVVLLGGGFALGRVTAPDDDGDEVSIQVPSQPEPDTSPVPPLGGGAFLGVVTEPAAGEDGVEIVRVSEGSAAEDGGLEAGDVITEVEGEPVADPSALRAAIAAQEPGDEVTITYRRDGEEQEATVELGDRPREEETPNN